MKDSQAPSLDGDRPQLEVLRLENLRLTEALKEARDLVGIAPAFLGFLSPEGVVLGLNELALRVIEASPEKVVGHYFWEGAWWKSLPESVLRIKEAVAAGAGGKASQFDLDYCAVNQGLLHKRTVALAITPFTDENGKVFRLAATGVDISDRMMARESLKKSQEQLARAVEVSKVGFYDWDIAQNIVTFSQQMKDDWDIGDISWRLEQCFDRLHPQDRKRVKLEIDVSIQKKTRFYSEYRIIKLNQEVVWIEARGEIQCDPAGKPVRFFGTSRNISDRKKIEDSLVAEKHKFEAIFVSSPAAMALLKGPEFVFEKINPPYQALFPDRIIVGKLLHEAIPEFKDQPFLKWMHEVFESGMPFKEREVLARLERTPGGESVDHYFDLTYMRVNDGENKPYGIYVHAIDITEKVLSRKQLEESELRFRHLADAMPQIVWTARTDGNLDYFNRRWYEMTGASPQPPTSEKSWAPFVNPKHLESTREAWLQAVRTGDDLQVEHALFDVASGQYRWTLTRAIPVRDSSGNILKWFGTGTDIHDVIQIQEDLSRSNSELARFAFVASHDLKEPLRVVSNYVQLLSKQYKGKLDEKADRYIEFAVSGVKRMYELIDDVLAFSRIGAASEDFKETDLSQIVKVALSNLEIARKENDATVVASPLPTLVVEPGLMLQLWQNLIGNALKYRDRERAPKIEIQATKVNADWVFSVKDNGIGVDNRYLDKIFVLFERLHGKDVYSGTGIGLAICKKIVARHGGRIWAESELGKGTTFFFQIPERSP